MEAILVHSPLVGPSTWTLVAPDVVATAIHDVASKLFA